jgi:hypothetical protein
MGSCPIGRWFKSNFRALIKKLAKIKNVKILIMPIKIGEIKIQNKKIETVGKK